MLAPGFVSSSIKVPSHNGDAELPGHEVKQSVGWPLILAQRPTRKAKRAHLYAKTEAIGVAAMLSHINQNPYRLL